MVRFSKVTHHHYVIAFIVIVFCAFAGYYEVGLMQHPMKYDMIDYFFPSRHFIAEMLHSRSLPLWNPYQNMGYPIHADPQSGAWYPLAWLLGLLGGYSIYSANTEFIIHIVIAGYGMYCLGKKIGFDHPVALIVGIGYMFSGMFVGNAQHLSWVISAAWLPWLFVTFLILLRQPSMLAALLFAVVLFMFISGGYPAFLMVSVYVFSALLLMYLITYVYTKQYTAVYKTLTYAAVSVLITILLSSIIVVSTLYVIPYITRGNGITAQLALGNPFSPQCCISFLLPFTVVGHDIGFFNTDLSMGNAYFGIVLFVFAAVGLCLKKDTFLWFITVTGFVCLLIAFGGYTPIRKWLYDVVPLMNMFRFPSLFRLFVIFAGLLLAGHGLQHYFNNSQKLRKPAAGIAMALIVVFAGIIIWVRMHTYLNMKQFVLHDLLVFSPTSTIGQHAVFQCFIQIIVLLAFVVILFRIGHREKAMVLMLVLSMTDLFVATRLNSAYTIHEAPIDMQSCNSFIESLPHGFPMPNDSAIGRNELISKHVSPFWRNLCMLNKQVSNESFTPFSFRSIKLLEDSFPQFYTLMLTHNLLYIGGSIYPTDSLPEQYKRGCYTDKTIYVPRHVYDTIEYCQPQYALTDTIIKTQYNPHFLQAVTHNKHRVVAVLMQNNYVGWKARINGQEAKIFTANLTNIGVLVPPGDNCIEFVYNPAPVKIAYYISIAAFLLVLGAILVLMFTKPNLYS